MEFVIGGLAATSAGFFTNPLEVVKHYMEMSKKSQFGKQQGGFLTKKKGLNGLQKGLSPALGAHLVSYGMKLGTYQFGQNRGLTTNANGDVNVFKSVSTSCVGGLLGQYLSNPFYLIKATHDIEATQENDKQEKLEKKSYSDTVKRIYREQGLRGFFRGATASLPRAFIGTSQLTSFAVAKESLNKFETFQENRLLATVLAGSVAGAVLTMATTPFDLVLTSMYKQAIGAYPNGPKYSSYLDCMKKIYKTSGLKPFYRGMGPLYIKLGPHTTLCLVFWEELTDMYEKNKQNRSNKEYQPVPADRFYEKIGFLTKENHEYNKFFLNENSDADDNKMNVYWN